MKLTPELKAEIEAKSLENMLRIWRFAPIGNQLCSGESGALLATRMRKLKAEDPAAFTAASKRVGWGE